MGAGFDPEITEEQFDGYERALAWLRQEMRLVDWVIELKRELPPENADVLAAVWLADHRGVADVYLGQGFSGYTPKQQLESLVHELVHAHMSAVSWWVRETVSQLSSPSGVTLLHSTAEQHFEWATDNIAKAWAATLGVDRYEELIAGTENGG